MRNLRPYFKKISSPPPGVNRKGGEAEGVAEMKYKSPVAINAFLKSIFSVLRDESGLKLREKHITLLG